LIEPYLLLSRIELCPLLPDQLTPVNNANISEISRKRSLRQELSVRVERALDLAVVLDGRPAPGLSCLTGFAGAGFGGKAAAKEFTGLIGETYFFGAVLLDPPVVLAVVLGFVLGGDVVESL
jgi:hypothetical protein